MRWPLVTRRRYEEAVARHHAWHMDAHREWARLFRAIAEHRHAATWAYSSDQHDPWDRKLWQAIEPTADLAERTRRIRADE